MTQFVDVMMDCMPNHSKLQNKNNAFRQVLDKTIGAWFEANPDVYEEVFLTSATGGWLDAHGRDYGVSRKLGESDDDYRERIIFEKLEYLTVRNLMEIYGLELFVYVSGFDVDDNTLTSDNPYLSDRYMAFASNELQNILNKKFIIEDMIEWL